MRDITQVLRIIIPLVEYPVLKRILENNLDSTYYAAPELIPHWWKNVTSTLSTYLNYPPKYDWEYNVISVWADKEVSELRKEFQGGN